jgi:hypothetical protein
LLATSSVDNDGSGLCCLGIVGTVGMVAVMMDPTMGNGGSSSRRKKNNTILITPPKEDHHQGVAALVVVLLEVRGVVAVSSLELA